MLGLKAYPHKQINHIHRSSFIKYLPDFLLLPHLILSRQEQEIEHYMKVVKAIKRTIEVQRKVDEVLGGYNRLKKRQRGIPQRMQTKKNHANIYEACLLGG